MQGINLNQLKLKVNETYEKDEKITTFFEPHNNDDVINKTFLDVKILRTESQISCVGKNWNEFTLHNSKQSLEDLPIERAVRLIIQTLYDKGLFDTYRDGNAPEVLKDYLLNKRRKPVLEESKWR